MTDTFACLSKVPKPFKFATTSMASVETEYEILGELGKGTFSVVRQVRNKRNGLLFAMKIFKKKHLRLELLQREILIMKEISHPNVLPLIEVMEDSQGVYLILELATGGELFHQLVSRGTFTENDAGDVVRQLLLAVQYLHSKFVVHRDIKLDNLLCRAGGKEILLADFGLSRIFQKDIEQMWTQTGSPEYMAPEVLQGKPYNELVDCWAVGIVTFALLTGCFPFYAEKSEELFSLIQTCSIHWHEVISVSDNARDFIEKLMTKKPEDRMTAAQALQHPWIRGDTHPKANLKSSLDKLLSISLRDLKTIDGKSVLPPTAPRKNSSPKTEEKNNHKYSRTDSNSNNSNNSNNSSDSTENMYLSIRTNLV